MVPAAKIMTEAAALLLDEGFVRWMPSELAAYIDEAVKTIVMAKPAATSETVNIVLERGTKQALPTDQRYEQLLDIVRNVEGTNGAAGRAIRVTSRSELDSNAPRWHDPAAVPFRKEVRQFVFDETLPREFSVFPGNDGTGTVEAIVSTLPQPLSERVTANVDDIASYQSEAFGLREIYEPVVKNYVLFLAFSKEDPAAAPQRAMAYYQMFAAALGIQSQVEASTSPTRKKT